jgi:hypothetical protein
VRLLFETPSDCLVGIGERKFDKWMVGMQGWVADHGITAGINRIAGLREGDSMG